MLGGGETQRSQRGAKFTDFQSILSCQYKNKHVICFHWTHWQSYQIAEKKIIWLFLA